MRSGCNDTYVTMVSTLHCFWKNTNLVVSPKEVSWSCERIWPNGGSISVTRSILGVDTTWILPDRMECQKWRNITRKFGVTSAGPHIDPVLGGACSTRAWHDPWGICLEFCFCITPGTLIVITRVGLDYVEWPPGHGQLSTTSWPSCLSWGKVTSNVLDTSVTTVSSTIDSREKSRFSPSMVLFLQ